MDIVFEDEHLMLLNKPAGQCFHSEEGHLGFVEEVREAFKDPNLFPVHRLDKVTSGGLLFAKGSEVNRKLSQLFEKKKIKKQYLAISDERPKKKQGLISGDMEKTRGGSYKLARTYKNAAITRFEAKRLELDDKALWAFLLRPETGKTHQLRVACKSLGSPVLGDKRYGGSDAVRCYLHAWRLEFELDGRPYSLVVPVKSQASDLAKDETEVEAENPLIKAEELFTVAPV